MTSYRRRETLRARRYVAPEPPFFCATALSPYTSGGDPFIAIDLIDGLATAADRDELAVCHDSAAELERMKMLREPLLIDGSSTAETTCGEAAKLLQAAVRQKFRVTYVGSAAAPRADVSDADVVVLSAWSPTAETRPITAPALRSGAKWGIVVPIIPPLTTELTLLTELVANAAEAGASFCVPLALDIDPVARHAAVSRLEDVDDETFAWMFDERFDLVVVSTERHLAALAHERGMSDVVPLPDVPVNWRMATLLTQIGYKLQRMERDVELAWALQKSARIIAALKKPVDLIATAASLAIVNGLDATSIEVVEQSLREQRSDFADEVNADWRLRRDHYR